MKILKHTVPVLVLFLALGFASCSEDEPESIQDRLSADEISALQYLREEEKLARDIYMFLERKYQLNIYSNIAAAEQRHMDMVLSVMDKYDVKDVSAREAGKFNLPALQALYDQLVIRGDSSVMHGLIVGAGIEDLDICDLNNASEMTANADLINVYNKLTCGSRNHIRAFYEQIKGKGGDYGPQFITQELFEDINGGAHENCNAL